LRRRRRQKPHYSASTCRLSSETTRLLAATTDGRTGSAPPAPPRPAILISASPHVHSSSHSLPLTYLLDSVPAVPALHQHEQYFSIWTGPVRLPRGSTQCYRIPGCAILTNIVYPLRVWWSSVHRPRTDWTHIAFPAKITYVLQPIASLLARV